MTWPVGVVLIALLWVGYALTCRWLLTNPRGDVATGLLYHGMRAYALWFHGLRVEGVAHIPSEREPGPLIVVANHTAGIDPVLVQAACPFEIRWMMAMDMMLPVLRAFWEWTEVIPVNRAGNDRASARKALRYVESGGVLGVFPEGRLERPAKTIMPFLPGIGLLVARTGAKVLPVVIEGTPQVDPAWASLARRSRSRVTFHPPMDFTGCSATEIVAVLRERYREWTGWKLNDEPRALGVVTRT